MLGESISPFDPFRKLLTANSKPFEAKPFSETNEAVQALPFQYSPHRTWTFKDKRHLIMLAGSPLPLGRQVETASVEKPIEVNLCVELDGHHAGSVVHQGRMACCLVAASGRRLLALKPVKQLPPTGNTRNAIVRMELSAPVRI